ncbi:MAG: thiamine phosphate synthase [Chlamydiales bacterium]|nr:thiamine phosphate synthase [Chlamydiales bacterium]
MHAIRRCLPFDLSLYVVTHRSYARSEVEFCYKCLRAAAGGINALQFREHNKEALERTVMALKKPLQAQGVKVFINNHLDLAIKLGVDGLHIGQGDVSFKEARNNFDGVIGLTVDTWKQLEEAQHLDVDYIGLSQLFPGSETKPERSDPYWLLEGLSKARAFSRHRIVPIGGINLDNLESVFEQLHLGSCNDGVALGRAIFNDTDPFYATLRAKVILSNVLNRRGSNALVSDCV